MRTGYFALCFLLGWTAVDVWGQARLTLSAPSTNVAVGEAVTLTLSVENAPAFACWGAVIEMPSNTLAVTQQDGALPVFVPDSRAAIDRGAHFGGYATNNHAGGTYVLARITVHAAAPGRYMLSAPPYSPSQRFGGLLLPLGQAAVIPEPAILTLNVTDAPMPPDLQAVTLDRGTIRMVWSGGAVGSTQYVEMATNLITDPVIWQPIYTNLYLSPGQTNTFLFSNEMAALYFRIRGVAP